MRFEFVLSLWVSVVASRVTLFEQEFEEEDRLMMRLSCRRYEDWEKRPRKDNTSMAEIFMVST